MGEGTTSRQTSSSSRKQAGKQRQSETGHRKCAFQHLEKERPPAKEGEGRIKPSRKRHNPAPKLKTEENI
jgi:hypothetical protein